MHDRDHDRYTLRQLRHRESVAWAEFHAALDGTDMALIRRLMLVYLHLADRRAQVEERLGRTEHVAAVAR